MMLFGTPIRDTKYAWELALFHRYRMKSDGITWFEFKINNDFYRQDHTPRFEFSLIVLNFVIFEFEVYNMYHTDNELYDS